MGLEALFLVEAKTRLILLEKEIDALVDLIDHAGTEMQSRYTPTLASVHERFQGMEEDLELLHQVDESGWGEFCSELDAEIHKLMHEVSVIKAEFEEQMAFA